MSQLKAQVKLKEIDNMCRIIDMGDYCVHTKYILSVSISDDNKQERDRDYKKICNEWKNNTDKYGD